MNFFFHTAEAAGSITNATPLTAVLLNAFQFLLSIALVVAIIGTVVAGIWYLGATGDEGRLRIAKKAMLACVIGGLVVLSALVVLTQLGSFFSGV